MRTKFYSNAKILNLNKNEQINKGGILKGKKMWMVALLGYGIFFLSQDAAAQGLGSLGSLEGSLGSLEGSLGSFEQAEQVSLATNHSPDSYTQYLLEEEKRWDEIMAHKKRTYRERSRRIIIPSFPMKNYGLSDSFLGLFLVSLADVVETRGMSDPYSQSNLAGSSAYGRYQMTPGFWETYCYAYCSANGLPRQIFDITIPANQDMIALFAAGELFEKFNNGYRSIEQVARLMAKEWYGGPGRINWAENQVPNPGQNNLTLGEYMDLVVSEMKNRLGGRLYYYEVQEDFHNLPWPVKGRNVYTSTFGVIRADGHTHSGLDIDGQTGDEIIAIANGDITASGFDPYKGNYIRINHGNGFVSEYHHLSRIILTSGYVAQGQTIGLLGNTGESRGSHCHLTIKFNGTPVDPLNYLDKTKKIHIHV